MSFKIIYCFNCALKNSVFAPWFSVIFTLKFNARESLRGKQTDNVLVLFQLRRVSQGYRCCPVSTHIPQDPALNK